MYVRGVLLAGIGPVRLSPAPHAPQPIRPVTRYEASPTADRALPAAGCGQLTAGCGFDVALDSGDAFLEAGYLVADLSDVPVVGVDLVAEFLEVLPGLGLEGLESLAVLGRGGGDGRGVGVDLVVGGLEAVQYLGAEVFEFFAVLVAVGSCFGEVLVAVLP